MYLVQKHLKKLLKQNFMGGNNGDEVPSPSPDDKKKLNIGKAIGCIGALSVFGATVFEESVKFYADKFSKGEECFLDDAYIASLKDERFTRYEDLWIEDANAYNFKAILSDSATVNSGVHTGMKVNSISIYQAMESNRLHIVKEVRDRGDGVQIADYFFRNDVSNNTKVKYNYKYYEDGALKSDSNISWSSWSISDIQQVSFTLYTNIPIFDSDEAWKKALSENDFSNALNYLKEYRLADWLQDNWEGELFDPLTGLSYLNDLANMAKHQGLNAIGNDPSLDDMKQHLRDIIANLKPGYDPVTNPSVDPALEPICYPDTIPIPVIDPTADVVLQPKEDPTPTPSPDPKPSNNPQPIVDPLPIPDSPAETIEDIADYVPTLADSFTDLGNGLKTKFPFSIPWDIHYILSGLATTPKAPRFELPLKVERYGIDETIVVDMARFQVLSDLSRSIFSLLFAMVLINLTIKVIGSLKEE